MVTRRLTCSPSRWGQDSKFVALDQTTSRSLERACRSTAIQVEDTLQNYFRKLKLGESKTKLERRTRGEIEIELRDNVKFDH